MKLTLAPSSLVGLLVACAGSLAWACGTSPPSLGGTAGSSNGTAGAGTMGSLAGPCYGNGTCNANLSCVANVCIPSSGAPQGSLGGTCYSNNTCDSGLSCLTSICIPATGAGGAGAGGAGAGGAGAGGAGAGGAGAGGAGAGGAGAGGAGSSGVAGNAGASGTAGIAGSSGTAGAAGGTGGTPSTLIVATDGWVGTGTNTVGIVGPWFVYSDVYSSIAAVPAGFVGAGSQVCASGTVSQSDTYGPTLGLNLYQPESTSSSTPGPYVPSAHTVTGFSFDIGGNVPSAIQFSYMQSDTAQSEYCTVMFPPKASGNVVSFSSTKFQCWTTGGAAAVTSAGYLSIHFQLPVNYFSDGQSFNFCITNLKAIIG